jgi:diaminopimelate decarboxylase
MQTITCKNRQLYCEEVNLSELADCYGTPLWVYSKAKLLHEFQVLQQAFSDVEPVICYSVKANGNLSLLQLLGSAGSSFDVVSGGELYRVQQAGCETSRVCFAGVGKTDEEIRFALEAGILMFTVESEAELSAIAKIAADRRQVAPVALRLNPDIDANTHAKTTTGKRGNKFGMDIERHNELARRVLDEPHLELRGIHMHLGSPINSTEPYGKAVEKACEVIDHLRREGHRPDWVDLGGGFGLDYRPGQAPTYEQFAAAIVPGIQRSGCRLALEPGRCLVGNAGVLVSQVIFIKQEGGKRFVIQDGAMNDLVRPAMYDAFHAIWPVRCDIPLPAEFESSLDGCTPADIVGPICESSDYLAKDRPFPPVERGDLLCTFGAGAYGTVMSSNYNARGRGAEVLVDGSQHQLIRRRESWSDLIAHEREYC